MIFENILQDFWVLMKESYTKNIRQGDFFSLENYTKVEDKIHILMSGRMSVKCDGVFLHNINPSEFVDSIEWKAKEFEDDPVCDGKSSFRSSGNNSEGSSSASFKVIGRIFQNNHRTFQVRNLPVYIFSSKVHFYLKIYTFAWI